MDPSEMAANCGCYEPVMADKCGQCKKPMPDVELADVQYWCDEPMADFPVPACSAACVAASKEATLQMIEDMRIPAPQRRYATEG